MGRLSIVIRAYNKERGIPAVIHRVLRIKAALFAALESIQELEFIVIDDASSDRTAQIAATYPEVTVISHKMNKGYGGALKTGFQKATGEYIGFLDADGSYPPEHFPHLCKAMVQGNADIIIGVRNGGSHVQIFLADDTPSVALKLGRRH